MLVDSHCHLENNEKLGDIMIHAADIHLEEHLQIAEKYAFVYTAAGAHPHQAKEFSALTAEDILCKIRHNKIIAIGEAGLDYYYDFAPREMQIRLFKENIKAAQQSGLPLIVHNRDSDEDMINLLREAYERKPFKAIIHCYSSSWALAEAALEMGFYISASGMITFGNAADLQEKFVKIPEDRLLVETDAPYLAPVPKRGQVNEPANVVLTAAKLAEVRRVSFEKMAQITTNNFKRLFEL